jgi:hypothetical protein
MNKPQVRMAIFDGLARMLVPAGFKGIRKDAHFKRKTDTGFQLITFSLVDYNPEFHFALTASLRVDAIEDIDNLFSGVSPEARAHSVSVAVGAKYFLGRPLRFEVSSEAEIEEAMRVLAPFLNESLLPLLDACVSLPAVERLLNGSGERKLNCVPDWQARSGMVAAALCRRPDYDQILAGYRQALAGYNQAARQRFEALVAHLAEHA